MTPLETEIMEGMVSNYVLKCFNEFVINGTFTVNKGIVVVRNTLGAEIENIFSIPNPRGTKILNKTLKSLNLTPFILNHKNLTDDWLWLEENAEDNVELYEALMGSLIELKQDSVKIQSYEKAAMYRDLEKQVIRYINKKKGLIDPVEEPINPSSNVGRLAEYIISYQTITLE